MCWPSVSRWGVGASPGLAGEETEPPKCHSGKAAYGTVLAHETFLSLAMDCCSQP
jgi:hypothetical protein